MEPSDSASRGAKAGGRAESMGLRRPQPLGRGWWSLGSGAQPAGSGSGARTERGRKEGRNGAEERNRIESRDATAGEWMSPVIGSETDMEAGRDGRPLPS